MRKQRFWPEHTRPLNEGWAFSDSAPLKLVAPTGERFGPADLLSVSDVAEMRGITAQTLSSYLSRGLPSAGYGWQKVGRNSGWAIAAADAVGTKEKEGRFEETIIARGSSEVGGTVEIQKVQGAYFVRFEGASPLRPGQGYHFTYNTRDMAEGDIDHVIDAIKNAQEDNELYAYAFKVCKEMKQELKDRKDPNHGGGEYFPKRPQRG